MKYLGIKPTCFEVQQTLFRMKINLTKLTGETSIFFVTVLLDKTSDHFSLSRGQWWKIHSYSTHISFWLKSFTFDATDEHDDDCENIHLRQRRLVVVFYLLLKIDCDEFISDLNLYYELRIPPTSKILILPSRFDMSRNSMFHQT